MRPWTFPTRAAVLAAASLAATSCSRDLSSTEAAPFPSQPGVFADVFAPGVRFEAFGGSKLDAISIDATVRHSGSASMKVTIPASGDPTGGYAGGALVANVPRNLSGYNALTFWAKASISAALNVAGIGNDNTGTSKLTASASALALTPAWKKYVIPLPLASKLTQEGGLFYFAEGPENGAGYDLWIDDVQFEQLATITNPRPAFTTGSVNDEIGASINVAGTKVTFAVDGIDQTLDVAPGYFTFASSTATVATVSSTGAITLVGAGTSTVTAKLGATTAAGTLTVKAAAPPTVAAAVPSRSAADVISLFGTTYTNVGVSTWSAVWDQADVADVTIGGRTTKKYSKLGYAGVEFATPIDASAMGFMHMDVWTLDATAFKVKLVDFGANGVFAGGDDSEFDLTLSPTSNPSVTTGAWSSLDIPMSAFAGLASRGHLAQMIIAGASPTVYLQNIYFYKVPVPTSPVTAAPTPTRQAASVISLFSNAYTNVAVDTWSASWDQADVADLQIAGNDTKKYTNFVFAGIEFTSAPVNASAMTAFHMDLWTASPTATPKAFRIKLVDFGANGAFGGGDDVEHEITLTATTTPALATGGWVGIDIPLSAFTGLVTKGHLAQMIFSGDLPTFFIDNVYFYAPPSSPSVAAPTPTYPAADVISMYSAPYTNVPVDTWLTGWSSAGQVDVTIGSRVTKKYTTLVFAGIETVGTQINASAMTHFRMDIWTPDATGAPAVFKVKLVDFGANGAFAGGDDVEHELTFTSTSTPALATGSWVTLDIPLTQFTGLVTRGHMAQFIISGDPKTVFIDNVLFHK